MMMRILRPVVYVPESLTFDAVTDMLAIACDVHASKMVALRELVSMWTHLELLVAHDWAYRAHAREHCDGSKRRAQPAFVSLAFWTLGAS